MLTSRGRGSLFRPNWLVALPRRIEPAAGFNPMLALARKHSEKVKRWTAAGR